MSAHVVETMRRFRFCAELEAAADAFRRSERLARLARIAAANDREQRRLNAS